MENVWIVAEIGEIKFNRNGHAYLELIEKDTASDKIIAKASANIWSYTLRMLRPYFETTTGRELSSGLKVLVAVSVEFHELYGFSLNIKDIDPAYTLGDIELQRLRIIQQLTEEGVISMNKELDLPVVIQKIAVITSPTAAGYQDFMNQLQKNPYGYHFYCKLFPAVMQGDQTESSIITALDYIFDFEDIFDAVVIIRGGGSRSDLMWFDNYKLAYHITQFPLPVISGIGHEKDVSVVDLVSHTSLKTPTAAAEFLITQMAGFELRIDELTENMTDFCSYFFDSEYERVDSLANIMVPLVQKRLHQESNRIDLAGQKVSLLTKSLIERQYRQFETLQMDLKRLAKSFIKWKSRELEQYSEKIVRNLAHIYKKENQLVTYLENSVQHFNPENILKKGYSITKHNGKIISTTDDVGVEDELETILFKGKTSSIIKEKS